MKFWICAATVCVAAFGASAADRVAGGGLVRTNWLAIGLLIGVALGWVIRMDHAAASTDRNEKQG